MDAQVSASCTKPRPSWAGVGERCSPQLANWEPGSAAVRPTLMWCFVANRWNKAGHQQRYNTFTSFEIWKSHISQSLLMGNVICAFSALSPHPLPHLPFFSLYPAGHPLEVPPTDSGPVQGLFLLKRRFSLPLMLTWGLCQVTKNNVDCDEFFIFKKGWLDPQQEWHIPTGPIFIESPPFLLSVSEA